MTQGAVDQGFVWGNSLLSVRGGARGSFHYLQDHLGSPIRLLGGNNNASLAYDEFGVPEVTAAVEKFDNPFGFTGYQPDDVSGLCYAQARYYDPLANRFNGEDRVRDGFNWYQYARANPIRFVDRNGHVAIECNETWWANGSHMPPQDNPDRWTDMPQGSLPLPIGPGAQPIGPKPPQPGSQSSLIIQPPTNRPPIPNHQPAQAKLPTTGDPNSRVTLPNPDGTPKQDRWYGPSGDAVRDRDYNHGGSGHEFPHEHDWIGGERQPQRPVSPIPNEWESPSQNRQFNWETVQSAALTGIKIGVATYAIIKSKGILTPIVAPAFY